MNWDIEFLDAIYKNEQLFHFQGKYVNVTINIEITQINVKINRIAIYDYTKCTFIIFISKWFNLETDHFLQFQSIFYIKLNAVWIYRSRGVNYIITNLYVCCLINICNSYLDSNSRPLSPMLLFSTSHPINTIVVRWYRSLSKIRHW